MIELLVKVRWVWNVLGGELKTEGRGKGRKDSILHYLARSQGRKNTKKITFCSYDLFSHHHSSPPA